MLRVFARPSQRFKPASWYGCSYPPTPAGTCNHENHSYRGCPGQHSAEAHLQHRLGGVPTGRNVIILVHTYGGMKGLGEASPITSTDADTQRSIRKGQLGCPEGQTMSAAQQFFSFAV
jgi:hypothetical protein